MEDVKADFKRMGYVKKGLGVCRDSWYTPLEYVEMVRTVMGGIDLDPFSSVESNKVVKAKKIFTVDNSAFDNEWVGDRVFANPPYSVGIFSRAVDRFFEQRKNFIVGIILTNNVTETKAGQKLLKDADAVCFKAGRISFWNVDGKSGGPSMRGQIFTLHGKDYQDLFTDVFSKIGVVR